MIPLAAVLIGYLPGALIFRLPLAQRERRAALAPEERLFWQVLISLVWSLALGFVLAALDGYRFERLLYIDAAVCAALLLASRGTLRYQAGAAKASWTIGLPIVLVAIGCWRFFPASEYIIGGKDPGIYINEGIQIAQRGSIVIHDDTIAAVPDFARDLFFPSHDNPDYYSNRFMGFFLQDPVRGDVVGQFPHLFPMSIAVGYGVSGLTGARMAVGVWGIFGVLAVYFTAARAFGRASAFTAAVLLSLNVLEVFYGRYPNSELVVQACLFAALLAFARAQQDGDRFFAPVAGGLAGLLIFINTPYAVIALIAMAAASLLIWVVERRPPAVGFMLPLALAVALAAWYLLGPMRAYFNLPQVYVGHLPVGGAAGMAAAFMLAAGGCIWLRRAPQDRARAIVAWAVIVPMLSAAAYAWFVRHPGGRLAAHDAYALRTYTDFYILRVGLIAALAGLLFNGSRGFWRDPAMALTVAAFSFFLFYKIKIVPEHFWAGRRILPAILPGALVLGSSAAFGAWAGQPRLFRVARAGIGAIAIGVLGIQYLRAAEPVMPHVEYRGIIPYLEKLASSFTDRDLVLVESRASESDIHVLALPLVYIYARHVLVLNTPKPDKIVLREFLEDALKKYERVFFVGGGGTDLLSRKISAVPVSSEHVRVPEYESPRNAYPRAVRGKDFDYGIYQLRLGGETGRPFLLDVGYQDDLNVVRFGGKETTDGRTFRWTGAQSFVSVVGMTGRERELVLVMNDGGRPAEAPPAIVAVFLNEAHLGDARVGLGFQPYRFAIPADVAAAAAGIDDPAQLKLITTPWNPHQLLKVVDDRNLGVMVDSVEIR